MYYLQIAILALINSLLAIGAYIPLSAGSMVMCMGSLMSIGAIASAFIHAGLGVPLLLSIFAGGLVSLVAGVAIGMLCDRLVGFLFAVATLGIGELLRVIVINSEALGGALGYKEVNLPTLISYALSLGFVFACALALLLLFERSAARKALSILRENTALATSLGISSSFHKTAAVGAGGFLAGMGGGFYIHNVGILDPRLFGFESSLVIITFAIIGGSRNFLGPILAAITLTVIPELLRFSTTYRMILYGIVLVLVVLLRPEGLLRVPIGRMTRSA